MMSHLLTILDTIVQLLANVHVTFHSVDPTRATITCILFTVVSVVTNPKTQTAGKLYV